MQEIEVKVKVGTDKAVDDLNKLGNAFDSSAKDAKDAQNAFEKTNDSLDLEPSINNLKQLKKELKAATAGTKDFDRLSMSIREMEDAIGDAKKSNDDFLGQMENAGGPLGMLGRGIRSAETATSSFSGALKATGIGLVVALIGGLVAAFSENEGAMKKIQPLIDGLKKAFQGVFRAVEPLFNTFVDLATDALPYVTKGIGMVYSAMMAYFTFLKESGGGALKILKGIFTLDADAISSGIDQIGGSFKKTTTSYTDSMKRFETGSKELTEREKAEAEKREENRKKAQEKKDALDEKAKQKAIEKAKAEAEALAKVKDEANKEAIRQGESFREQLENAEKTERDAKKANADALLTEQELAIQNENLAYETKKANAIKFGTDYQEIERQHLNTLNDINLTAQEKQYNEDKIATEKRIAIDQAYQEAKRNALDTGLGILQQFAGKNKSVALGILAIQKGLAIADIVVGASKAISSASSALAATPAVIGVVPNPMYAVQAAATIKGIATTKISAATSIASILAAGIGQASSITGGGGGSAGGGGGGISAPAPTNFNQVGASGTNQIAQTIAGQNQQPIQAYVVAGAVTSAQSLNRNIIESATIN